MPRKIPPLSRRESTADWCEDPMFNTVRQSSLFCSYAILLIFLSENGLDGRYKLQTLTLSEVGGFRCEWYPASVSKDNNLPLGKLHSAFPSLDCIACLFLFFYLDERSRRNVVDIYQISRATGRQITMRKPIKLLSERRKTMWFRPARKR